MPADPRPYPASEMISLNVLATLGGVSTAAGYKVSLKVERAMRPPQTPERLLAVIYEGDDQPAPDEEVPIGMAGWVRPYAVLIWAMGSEASAEPYDVLVNLARADVERALMQDHTRGGFARNTTLGPPSKIEDPNEPVGVIVTFDVLYTTLEADPYRLG